MQSIQGPAIALAPYVSDKAPFDTLENLAAWAQGLGFTGVELPTWDARVFDLQKAAGDQAYCDHLRAVLAAHKLTLVALSTERQGRLVAAHPAYDAPLDALAPPQVRGNPQARAAWAAEQLVHAAYASARLGVSAHVTVSGSLLLPYLCPGPSRPAGIVDTGFAELGRRWRVILDVFDQARVDVGFAPLLGQDVSDGATFERFLASTGGHPRCKLTFDPGQLLLQQIDYLDYLDSYRSHLALVHVTDAEQHPNGRRGIYGSFADWADRSSRPRAAGDGQIDLIAVFERLARHGYGGWAVLDWACAVGDRLEGAEQGAAIIAANLVQRSGPPLPSESEAAPDEGLNRRLLGVP